MTLDILEPYLQPLASLMLALRAVVSRDGQRRRVAGAVLAVLPVLAGPLMRLMRAVGGPRASSSLMLFWTAIPLLMGTYLFAWAFRSRDPQVILIVFAVVGVTLFLSRLYVFATFLILAFR